jgi:(p)ppGpp synthase/HD superfamily hydrolase
MIILDAVKFAREAHEGQQRKYTFKPYVFHPINVGFILTYITSDENIIVGGILHDVIEDTDATEDDILHMFGRPITDYVMDVTNISKPEDGNRKVRKRIDREHLAEARPESKTIKLADIIDNARSIVKNDPDFAKVWLGEKKELLPYLVEGDARLYTQVHHIIIKHHVLV